MSRLISRPAVGAVAERKAPYRDRGPDQSTNAEGHRGSSRAGPEEGEARADGTELLLVHGATCICHICSRLNHPA
jgi:hypothetical protein